MSDRGIVEAWLNPGPRPDLHAAAQARLAREWPALHAAIEEHVAAYLERERVVGELREAGERLGAAFREVGELAREERQ